MDQIRYTNSLINEHSPYLLQHAHNPVNWFAWNEATLQKAKDENKLILISVGYAACHWCHVMEKESFEDESIAQIMNEHFVCIKVDREERPDIDQIYMEAVQMIAGSGGWPLNCFALPNGQPVYGGTYFQPDHWKNVLEQLAGLWQKNPQKLNKAAEELMDGISRTDFVKDTTNESSFSADFVQTVYKRLEEKFDYKNGGLQGAPKFPMPVIYEFMLVYWYTSKNKSCLNHLEFTLEKIADGGIYDHLVGGFARYSVDAEWIVPHFEKMLYDNAQLIELYSKVYKVSGNNKFKALVAESISFIKTDLTDENGSFYSSYDADSDGVEGKYYVWNKPEIDIILGDDSALFCDYYTINDKGNWEPGKNILHRKIDCAPLREIYDLTENEIQSKIANAKVKLLEQRQKRVKPALDSKILSSWNALMINALVEAFTAFSDQNYLDMALKDANNLLNTVVEDSGKVYRTVYSDKKIPGLLDDYSLLIKAFINLYQTTSDEMWVIRANKLMDYCMSHFLNSEKSMFYYTDANEEKLIARKVEFSDNVIPSSNSVMAENLLRLFVYMSNPEYKTIASRMLLLASNKIGAHPEYFSNWLKVYSMLSSGLKELAITGVTYKQNRDSLLKQYLPNVILASAESKSELAFLQNRFIDQKNLFFLCENNICKAPMENVEEVFQVLELD